MRVVLALLFALAIMPGGSRAQAVWTMEAVTETGASVVLYEDGTWAPERLRSDGPPEVIAPVREGERAESTQYRYVVWVPEGWEAPDVRLMAGELEFARRGAEDGVRVSVEMLPHAAMADWGHRGPARLQAVQRLVSLFSDWVEIDRVAADELVVEGHRASRARLQAPGMDMWVAAVEVPVGVLLLTAVLETGEGDVEAVGHRFLQGLEIDDGFTRDPCEVFLPLRHGFAIDLPAGWAVERQLEASEPGPVDLELVEADPNDAPARAFVVTVPDDGTDALENIAEALVGRVLEGGAPENPWNAYMLGPGPVGYPEEIAQRTYATGGGTGIVDVVVVRGGGHVALAAVDAQLSSAMRYGAQSLSDGLRVCR